MSNAILYNSANWLDQFFRDFDRSASPQQATLSPAVDIVEDKDAFHLRVELPGVKKEDISVGVKENRLTLTGKKESAWQNSSDGYRYFESRFGSFNRSFELPRNVKADAIEAKYEQGVLTLRIPKAAEAVEKSINIL